MNEHQMTLGDLIGKLRECKQDAPVYFDFGYFAPDGIDSYRGYYDQLALGYKEYFWHETKPTAASLLAECEAAVGRVFTGYKGGEFIMDERTRVWVSRWGECAHTAVADITSNPYTVIIHTCYKQDY